MIFRLFDNINKILCDSQINTNSSARDYFKSHDHATFARLKGIPSRTLDTTDDIVRVAAPPTTAVATNDGPMAPEYGDGDLTYYPAYCNKVSPTYFTWVKLDAVDVHALKQRRGFEGMYHTTIK